MIFLLLALTFSAFGSSDSLNALEKSYPRDNTFCSHKYKRVEILIRGNAKFTESKDKGYGELLFYRMTDKKPVILEISARQEDTYGLFMGSSPGCSKSHGYMVDSDTMAILLLKENRPFEGKLVIQFFDMKTMTPKNFLETEYPVERAIKTKDGFAFKTIDENHHRDTGKVTIEGQPFIYSEREFPKWISYSAKGFEPSAELTYSKFPHKKSFKDMQDFHQVTGWDPAQKAFTKNIFYYAVNHQLRKKCLLFIDKKQPISGNEIWRCQAI